MNLIYLRSKKNYFKRMKNNIYKVMFHCWTNLKIKSTLTVNSKKQLANFKYTKLKYFAIITLFFLQCFFIASITLWSSGCINDVTFRKRIFFFLISTFFSSGWQGALPIRTTLVETLSYAKSWSICAKKSSWTHFS